MSPATPSWPRQSCQKAWLSHSQCAAPFSAQLMRGAIPISSTALISGSAGPDLASSRNTIRLALCHPARPLTSIHVGTSSSMCRRPYRDLGHLKQNSCFPVRRSRRQMKGGSHCWPPVTTDGLFSHCQLSAALPLSRIRCKGDARRGAERYRELCYLAL